MMHLWRERADKIEIKKSLQRYYQLPSLLVCTAVLLQFCFTNRYDQRAVLTLDRAMKVPEATTTSLQ